MAAGTPWRPPDARYLLHLGGRRVAEDTARRMAMNSDVFAGKWKQMKGKAKEWWGELSDDDLTRIEGSRDRLVGVLQERYGYTKEKAEEEISRRTSGMI
jgi:uncharacterized protein YjbJ (UPF0337 family)